MKTLVDLLELPRFSDLVLLTDKTTANLEVDSIEITETPDISLYIPEKTFLLTTAMIYQEHQTDLFALIDSLQEKRQPDWGSKLGVLLIRFPLK